MSSSGSAALRAAVGLWMLILVAAVGAAHADVEGYVAGVDLDGAKCRNVTDPQLVFDYRTGLDTFDCGTAGMTMAPDDRYFLKIQATAGPAGSGTIGIEITSNHTVDRVGCRNITTGQRIFLFLPLGYTGFFDCTETGLDADEGDEILFQIGGIKP